MPGRTMPWEACAQTTSAVAGSLSPSSAQTAGGEWLVTYNRTALERRLRCVLQGPHPGFAPGLSRCPEELPINSAPHTHLAACLGRVCRRSASQLSSFHSVLGLYLTPVTAVAATATMRHRPQRLATLQFSHSSILRS